MTEPFDIKIDKDRRLIQVRAASKLRAALVVKYPTMVPGDSIGINQLLHLVKPGTATKVVGQRVQNFYFQWSKLNGVAFRSRLGLDEQSQQRMYIVPAKGASQNEFAL
jgi:hypothetical protein